jgi:hypothetical protein
LYLLNFAQQIQQEVLGKDLCLSTSPDRKWLAYCQAAGDSPTGHWLIVESADGQQKAKIPLGENWLYFTTGNWLDNERLVFNLFPESEEELYPIVVVTLCVTMSETTFHDKLL